MLKDKMVEGKGNGQGGVVARRRRGQLAYLSGHAAEKAVATLYAAKGGVIAARNWRGKGGEIDIIAREGDCVVFIEVKKAASHALAAERLRQSQIGRLYIAAAEFLSGEPSGELTEARFDVALVDAMGRVEILENAIAA